MKDGGRYLGGVACGQLGFCTPWAVNDSLYGPEWVEIIHQQLKLKNLPGSFKDFRIVQLSDLHCSSTVSHKYLYRCIKRVNQLAPDIVLLTGDYITHDYNGRFRQRVAKLLSYVKADRGIYACLGNHDYGFGGWLKRRDRFLADEMAKLLTHRGITVLRNESCALEIEQSRLWFVGLGDLWAGDFRPDEAFARIEKEETVIALAHNPSCVRHLDNYGIDVVVSGHTHGNWVDVIAPFGRPVISRRFYRAGMYEVAGKKLYVNRGLGRLGRAFFNTRPEITVFDLS